MSEVKLMKGNEAIAVAAIRCGCDGYFGYPITPQSEIMETLMLEAPWDSTGMVVLQAESEVAAINMVYGGASCGKKVMTSSSSPGVSLKQEGISYLCGAELPSLLVNVMRGGPGLGTIQPSQADYFQSVKGGGHGDYKMIVLAPNSVQEMNDFVDLGFKLSFKYRVPTMILSDGVIGQMMEKVELSPIKPRMSNEEIKKKYGNWATTGKTPDRDKNVTTSLALEAEVQEATNLRLQAKYREIEKKEVRCEKYKTDDAEYLLIAFGSCSRICSKTVDLARAKGLKLGMLRPITLFPFPTKEIQEISSHTKGILVVEMNAGQMLEDVRLTVNGSKPVEFYGRLGGVIPTPEEVEHALEDLLINKKH